MSKMKRGLIPWAISKHKHENNHVLILYKARKWSEVRKITITDLVRSVGWYNCCLVYGVMVCNNELVMPFTRYIKSLVFDCVKTSSISDNC